MAFASVEYDLEEAWMEASDRERKEFMTTYGNLSYNVVTEYIYRIKYLHLDTEKSALEILEEIEGILR